MRRRYAITTLSHVVTWLQVRLRPYAKPIKNLKEKEYILYIRVYIICRYSTSTSSSSCVRDFVRLKLNVKFLYVWFNFFFVKINHTTILPMNMALINTSMLSNSRASEIASTFKKTYSHQLYYITIDIWF